MKRLARTRAVATLCRRMAEDMKARKFGPEVIERYVGHVSDAAAHFNSFRLEKLGPRHIRAYQVSLLVDKGEQAESYPGVETVYIGEIAGTEEDALYRTDRVFLTTELRPLAYRVPFPPGSYSVTLHFAERWFVKPGARVFDVLLEGKKVLERYDAVQRVGPAAADRQALRGVHVEDGILDIELEARTDTPSIAAIEIAPER